MLFGGPRGRRTSSATAKAAAAAAAGWTIRLALLAGGRAPRSPELRRRWTDERIRATLDLYLKDKRVWPAPEEFRADGFAQLRDAITRSGGIDRWLVEFGLPDPHHLRGRRTWWADERIEAELRRLADGRQVFPTVPEFRRAGQTALLTALRRHGGTGRWAARLDLPRRERCSGRIVGVVCRSGSRFSDGVAVEVAI